MAAICSAVTLDRTSSSASASPPTMPAATAGAAGSDASQSVRSWLAGMTHSDSDAIEKERAKVLADYVKANGLDVTKYQDEGWDPVELAL